MKRDNRLYELRTSRRLTQIAVACKLNLSSSRVSAYENGDNIPCDVLKLFAEFYGVSIDYISRTEVLLLGAVTTSFVAVFPSIFLMR